jgi:hypothetical protein
LVIIVGLVDGFMPSHEIFGLGMPSEKRNRLCDAERLSLYGALTRSSDTLVLSYFQKEDVELAQRLNMEIRRIQVEKGTRVALLSPSMYLNEMKKTSRMPLYISDAASDGRIELIVTAITMWCSAMRILPRLPQRHQHTRLKQL